MLKDVTVLRVKAIYQSLLVHSPACRELQQFSVSFALRAVAGADAVMTGSGQVGTSAEPAAPSGEQVVSHVLVAADAEPKEVVVERGKGRSIHGQKQRAKVQDRRAWRRMAQERIEK